MASGANQVSTGNYTGTGVAQDIALPFAPKVVIVINKTSNIISVKTKEMAGDSNTKIITDGTISTQAADGLTIPDQVPAGGGVGLAAVAKFNAGSDDSVNKDDDELTYIAFE